MTNTLKGIYSIFMMLIFFNLSSQRPCSFEHYSSNEGLPQSRINCITQDKNGFIWLGTYDGLIRFDGYEFQPYKVQSSNSNIALSNRVDRIKEDKFGRLWITSPDGVYSFTPETRKFRGEDANHQFKLKTPSLQIKQTGKVWLISDQEGCVCIKDSLFNFDSYSVENGKLLSNTIHAVYEDHHLNSWLLTDNGLGIIHPENTDSVLFVMENNTSDTNLNIPFYVATELNGEIWFGSSQGVIWRYSKNSKTFFEFKLNVSSNVRSFYKLDNHRIIILTANDGYFLYDSFNGKLKIYNKSTVKGLKSNTLDYVHINKPNQIWFTTNGEGIYKFDLISETLKYFTVPIDDKTINRLNNTPFIIKDKNNHLWVQPRGGGFSYYNKEKEILEPFFNAPDDPDKKFSNINYSTFFDRQGLLWMCTASLGLEKITFYSNEFSTSQIDPNNTSSLANHVRAIYQEKNGTIWLSTKDGRLFKSDKELNEFTSFSPNGEYNTNTVWPGSIYCITQDSKNSIWLGTKGAGLYKLSAVKNTSSYKIEHFQHDETDSLSLSNNNIYSIFEDDKQHIWIGTLGGGINLIDDSSQERVRFITHSNSLQSLPFKKCNRVRCIISGSNGKLYAGTSGGLLCWNSDFNSPEEIRFKHYSNKDGLSNNEIMDIVSSPKREVFLATFGGGLNKIISQDNYGFPQRFKTYSKEEGLQSDLIKAIRADKKGHIWISTENHLVRFNPESETFETFQETNQSLSGGVFSESATCQLENNSLVFGHSNGFIKFSPEMVNANRFSPNIILSNFQSFNKPLLNSKGDPYYETINQAKKIELKHNQNFFSIEFLALDYTKSKNIKYAYKLEGFDQDWNYSSRQRMANYTNIPGGKYQFKVYSTNSNGIWVNNERVLPITVFPSFWKTPLAYAIYLILVITILLFIQKYTLIIYKLKSDVRSQKEMSNMKLKFFTDISHEIRTPLTLITSPIDYLIHDNRTPEDIKKQLSYISQSTNRLLKLVNQILDFRRIQNQKLKVVEINLGQFVEKICLEFMDMAEEQGLNFSFQDLSGKANIWADRDALEKIVMNLLSNAFKYNKPNNTIKVTVSKNDKYTILKVSDNGPGISKDKQKDLFVRFAPLHEDSNNPSTGIGLSIIKDIADKHSAKVTVESAKGEGTTFLIHFLNGYTHFNKEVELVTSDKQENIIAAKTINEEKTIGSGEKVKKEVINKKDDKKPSILIVEDDYDLRNFIKTILDQDYIIYEAGDGEEGLSKAISLSPDFIVSDIMMPKMDGIELLKRLRNEISTSHIPIILLTAKTTIESKLAGLSYGADDYITKPFSVAYIKARIVNLIQQRKRLHSIYSSDINIDIVPEENHVMPNLITSSDEELMKKIIGFINQNIDNGDFSVEELGQLAGLSRSTFFNKLKSLTGMSPVEFIRDVRIKHAAHLIKTQQLLIKEVCYMSGFSDTKYFGKCFKNKYGMTPLQFRNTQ